MGETNEMLKMLRAEIEQAERRVVERTLGTMVSVFNQLYEELPVDADCEEFLRRLRAMTQKRLQYERDR